MVPISISYESVKKTGKKNNSFFLSTLGVSSQISLAGALQAHMSEQLVLRKRHTQAAQEVARFRDRQQPSHNRGLCSSVTVR